MVYEEDFKITSASFAALRETKNARKAAKSAEFFR